MRIHTPPRMIRSMRKVLPLSIYPNKPWSLQEQWHEHNQNQPGNPLKDRASNWDQDRHEDQYQGQTVEETNSEPTSKPTN